MRAYVYNPSIGRSRQGVFGTIWQVTLGGSVKAPVSEEEKRREEVEEEEEDNNDYDNETRTESRKR